jgi:hypothetical protein
MCIFPASFGDSSLVMFFTTKVLQVFWLTAIAVAHLQVIHRDDRCTITAHPAGGDDAPAILYAFEQCGTNASIIFRDQLYNIYSVMNTTGLQNVKVSLRGSLTVCHLPKNSS